MATNPIQLLRAHGRNVEVDILWFQDDWEDGCPCPLVEVTDGSHTCRMVLPPYFDESGVMFGTNGSQFYIPDIEAGDVMPFVAEMGDDAASRMRFLNRFLCAVITEANRIVATEYPDFFWETFGVRLAPVDLVG